MQPFQCAFRFLTTRADFHPWGIRTAMESRRKSDLFSLNGSQIDGSQGRTELFVQQSESTFSNPRGRRRSRLPHALSSHPRRTILDEHPGRRANFHTNYNRAELGSGIKKVAQGAQRFGSTLNLSSCRVVKRKLEHARFPVIATFPITRLLVH